MHAATSYGNTDNNLPPQTQYQSGFPDTTIFAALERAGVSNRYFFNDVPVSALWGPPGLARSGPISEYYTRCQSGTLPHVSYVDPNFAGSVGEGPGLSGDEHPHGDVRTGQAFMADVVHAFMESPQWKRRAVHRVRRVGRVLRARAPAARPRRPQRPRHRQGLRADGLAHPRRSSCRRGCAETTWITRPTGSSRS